MLAYQRVIPFKVLSIETHGIENYCISWKQLELQL